jgi:hypothetical protein
MRRVGSINEWYRFLDAKSDDEAVYQLRRWAAKLGDAHDAVDEAFRLVAYAPGGEVDDAVQVARSALSEALDMVNDVIGRFRAGEHTRGSVDHAAGARGFGV